MTARVLADLGRLQDDAAKVVLGAPRRGGLIFAGAGLAAGVIAEDLYSGLIVVGDADHVRGTALAKDAVSDVT